MRLLRGRHRPAVFALVLLVLAGLLAFFAYDVRTWQSTVKRDDLRFQADPSAAHLWKPSTLLPGDPAGLALSTDKTTEWRRALQAFWFTRLGFDPRTNADAQTLDADTEKLLQQMTTTAATPAERSDAANLLGVLVITTASAAAIGNNEGIVPQTLHQTVGYFEQAIALDPTNDDAKQNLELILRSTGPSNRVIREGGTGFGYGGGHGSSPPGYGY
ncbi:MAG TPA: hypothetical protein VHS03_06530 [Gaiellaceae bacterium]|nr:hypothetical protein [Gaiellaceae bacterium]